MRYNDTSGHWELWDDYQGRWVDLYTCDLDTAGKRIKQIMEAKHEDAKPVSFR